MAAMRSLVALGLLVVAGQGAEVRVQVDSSRAVAQTLKQHAAWSIEFGSGLLNPALLESPVATKLCQNLGPSLLRIGGSSQDEVRYDFSPNPADRTVGVQDVARAFAFANSTGWDLVWGLNYLFNRSGGGRGAASFSQAAAVVEQHMNNYAGPYGYEFGNEPDGHCPVEPADKCNVTVQQHARDDRMLSVLLDYEYQGLTGAATKPRPKIIGPDSAHCCDYLHDFAKASQELNYTPDALTWHHYYMGPTGSIERITSPETLDNLQNYINQTVEIRDTYAKGAQLWIGESASAYGGGVKGVSDRYAAVFADMDQLTLSARLGYSAVIRQGLFGGGYAVIERDGDAFSPNPSYYAYVMYKSTMGERVLDAGQLVVGRAVRVYAHCHPQNDGRVTIMTMNLDQENATVTIEGLNAKDRYDYVLSAPGNNMSSAEVELNGKTFAAKEDGSLPPITGRKTEGLEVAVAPLTITFSVFSVDVEACKTSSASLFI